MYVFRDQSMVILYLSLFFIMFYEGEHRWVYEYGMNKF
jgi:hypothetical protein